MKEKEIAKRREQLDESLEMVEQMREELKDANRRANGADWKAKERLLRMQMEEERVESERKLTTLEAKLKMVCSICPCRFGCHASQCSRLGGY